MKKSILILALIFIVSPIWADLCQNCFTYISSGKYCLACENKLVNGSQYIFQVTSPSLVVGKFQFQRRDKFRILQFHGDLVRIILISSEVTDFPVSGWVTCYELERNTNWKRPSGLIIKIPTRKTAKDKYRKKRKKYGIFPQFVIVYREKKGRPSLKTRFRIKIGRRRKRIPEVAHFHTGHRGRRGRRRKKR